MLSIYYPTRQVIRGSNVNGEERVHVLTCYKECMQECSKHITEEAERLRGKKKEKLFEGLSFVESTAVNSIEVTDNQDNGLFYLCGWMIKKGSRCFKLVENFPMLLQICNNSLTPLLGT